MPGFSLCLVVAYTESLNLGGFQTKRNSAIALNKVRPSQAIHYCSPVSLNQPEISMMADAGIGMFCLAVWQQVH